VKKKLIVIGVTAIVLLAIFVILIIVFTVNSDVQSCGPKFVSSSKLGRYAKVISINQKI